MPGPPAPNAPGAPPSQGYFQHPGQLAADGRGPGRKDPESSGSLSGHLLGREGDSSGPRSGTAKAIVIMAIILGLLIIVSLGVAFFAQDWISSTVEGAFG